MDVISIKHKVLEKNTFEDYYKKLAHAMSYKPNFILGPDYGLCFLKEDGKINFGSRENIINKLEELSLNSPDTLLVPGTSPFILGQGLMGHSQMVFGNGVKMEEFRKESNAGDSKIAKENGLEYEGGDSDKNKFFYNGKKITVEICSDHGKQRVDKDTFLELIPAYDDRAGFWVGAHNDDFSRWALLSDGRSPKIGCFRYNSDRSNERYGLLKAKLLNKDFGLFELDERNVSYF